LHSPSVATLAPIRRPFEASPSGRLLLFHLLDWLWQYEDERPAGYEVREVLGAHLSRLIVQDGEIGDLVVCAVDDVGGAMHAEEAAPLLAQVRAARPAVELPFDPGRLGLSLPAIIAPDPSPRQQPIKFGHGHPLDGVIIHPVSDVLARVRSLNREDLRDAESLLQLCADHRLVLSAIAPAGRRAAGGLRDRRARRRHRRGVKS
jgi:hypothetical protein